MGTDIPNRRFFVKQTALAAGALALHPFSPGKEVYTGFKMGDLHVVCIGAHPGDPEFGCGGTLLRYSDMGCKVSVVYLTKGEASNSQKTYQEMALLRTAEAERSCQLLKARPIFAGQVDGDTELSKTSIESFVHLISSLQPDLLLTHWPSDTHQDHQVAGMLGLNAWSKLGQSFDLFFYEVNTGSETMAFVPTDHVDITSVRHRKKEALLCHQTQDPQAVYNDFFKAMEEFRGLEAGVKAAEAFIRFKPISKRASLTLL